MVDAPAIRRLNPEALGTPPGYSQVVEVRAQRLIFISGQTATDADGNATPDVGAIAWSVSRAFFSCPCLRLPCWSQAS